MSPMKMDFYTKTCGRIFLSTMRMFAGFYSWLNKILSKALSDQEVFRGFWRHLLPLTVVGTKIKAALGNGGVELLIFPLNCAGG